MGLVTLVHSPPRPGLSHRISISAITCLPRRTHCSLRPLAPVLSRPDKFQSWRCAANIEVEVDCVTNTDEELDDISTFSSGCSIPILHHENILVQDPINLLTEIGPEISIFEDLPVLSEGEQHVLAATPVHPAGLYALYASYLFGNMAEQLWNFALPASLAILHQSLLPVAVVGFFTKLAVFIGSPILGEIMDLYPRLPVYTILNSLQVAAQLMSAAVIIYALKAPRHASATSLLIQPWFIVLVTAGAIERLAGLALGVSMERDWVVMLAGSNRPVALAQANSMLNRLDLLCETIGASVFGLLLSKYSPVSCLRIASVIMMCSLPILLILGRTINRLSCDVLSYSKSTSSRPNNPDLLLDVWRTVEGGIDTIRNGWHEYKQQAVLPASLASVLLYFNVALAPGAMMTALLMQLGISPSIIGGFSGLCSAMGFLATFISSTLVKHVGILKAGAAGLVFQAVLLSAALTVYWTGSISQQQPLLLFLALIVLSRLGHMSYDVVGTQILQTGIPASKANLIGTTEVSIASLAELIMLGMAITANEVSNYGVLAVLSFASVAGAAWMFCSWLGNPTNEQKDLFASSCREVKERMVWPSTS